MAEQIDWTTKLGKAFAADRTAVFDSIQRLRPQAQKCRHLKSTPQQEVETNKTTSSGQEVIVIEPTNPQVVYVPQYNTEVVYTQAPRRPSSSQEATTAPAVAAGLIGFTAGIAIGAAMDNNYYYGPYGWHGGGYMYNDAWDDYYDASRGRARGLAGPPRGHRRERGDRAENDAGTADRSAGERAGERPEDPGDAQQQRHRGRADAPRSRRGTTRRRDGESRRQHEARGYSEGAGLSATAKRQRQSDAFSGYSSGKSQRAASRADKQAGAARAAAAARGGDDSSLVAYE